MADALNNFELTILDRISAEYSFLKSHIPFLRVESRKSTGVGLYVDFYYLNSEGHYEPIPASFFALSSKSLLQMEGLKNVLSYEVAVTNGRIDFLEIVTIGEDWDGTIRNFWFE